MKIQLYFPVSNFHPLALIRSLRLFFFVALKMFEEKQEEKEEKRKNTA